ncbi:4,5-DOPA dioxygenase extradiol [Tolypocladium ophioglossoides CBS 100239]|uniref:4,5-DOPA dioxygenase extradiol n=1 Tax=Tolypocladium ophioglossoides (strain CBS 100239) TaxID=1163406 RepID=A0A0L0N513_TOLOC|nr:4,5-DOPA dioxygenase extradiol [Tolypocladium ophioglossoides CBS 100239]
MPVAPVIALSHGGGPLPILGDPNHKSIIYSLKNRVPKILGLGTPAQPRAIVLYNFPEEAYQLKYPAPGEPGVAATIRAAFEEAGLQPQLDDKRGWDHGVFVPLTLVNPKADIPVVQLSVLHSEDPTAHLRMGAALARLRADNIAIIGSGFASFHNFATMRAIRSYPPAQFAAFKADSDEWNSALTAALAAGSKESRWNGLKDWRGMPHADRMHPPAGGEHFMPLVVCAGAAGEGEETKFYKDEYSGLDIFTYYWGVEQVE